MANPLSEPTNDERLLSLVCHIASFVGMPVVIPAVIYLIQKDKSAFVRFHAVQAAVFQLVLWVALGVAGSVVGVVVSLTCGLGFPLLFLIPLVALVGGFWDAWHGWLAYQGQWAEFPMMEDLEARLGLDKKAVANTPPSPPPPPVVPNPPPDPTDLPPTA